MEKKKRRKKEEEEEEEKEKNRYGLTDGNVERFDGGRFNCLLGLLVRYKTNRSTGTIGLSRLHNYTLKRMIPFERLRDTAFKTGCYLNERTQPFDARQS